MSQKLSTIVLIDSGVDGVMKLRGMTSKRLIILPVVHVR